MKPLDRLLQHWRIAKTRPFLRTGDRVLDVGSADGALFRQFPWLGPGVGVDPAVEPSRFPSNARAVRGVFPRDVAGESTFDVIAVLAVLEHVPREGQGAFATACRDSLRSGGYALLTVPSPAVDRILSHLIALKVLDGMEVGQHYGFEAEETRPLFEGVGLRLVAHDRFQLGLNHFFAFRKSA